MHQHTKQITQAGKSLKEAKKAMIMIHGRGATAASILELANHLAVDDFSVLAPSATAHTWYPFSFMAPVTQNEPGISTAMTVIDEMVQDVLDAGIDKENLYLLGFSQGACVAGEYAARHTAKYGGIFMLSGGLIGQRLDRSNYQGNFEQTPILLGCSDSDAHVPLQRVKESSQIFREMGASVTERIYPNAPHTVFEDEIRIINEILSHSE